MPLTLPLKTPGSTCSCKGSLGLLQCLAVPLTCQWPCVISNQGDSSFCSSSNLQEGLFCISPCRLTSADVTEAVPLKTNKQKTTHDMFNYPFSGDSGYLSFVLFWFGLFSSKWSTLQMTELAEVKALHGARVSTFYSVAILVTVADGFWLKALNCARYCFNRKHPPSFTKPWAGSCLSVITSITFSPSWASSILASSLSLEHTHLIPSAGDAYPPNPSKTDSHQLGVS